MLLINEQIEIVNPEACELLPSTIILPRGAELDADAVFRVPVKDSQREVIVRFLLEHKSEMNLDTLIKQLVAYQHGLYERDNTPVVNVVVNNGPVPRFGDKLNFRTWLSDMDDDFWRVYDEYIMGFNAIVLNLQDPQVQQKLLKSQMPSAFGWYAMGKVSGTIGLDEGQNLIRMGQQLDEEGVNHVMLPTIDYLNYYQTEITMQWLRDLEIKVTGEDRVMTLALSSLELREQKGLQEGLQEGERKSRQETAEQMLKDDVEMKMIARYTGLSLDRLNALKDELQ